MDLPDLGPYNFCDLTSYDCSLAHSALATQTSDLEIGLPSVWKMPPHVATSIFNATLSFTSIFSATFSVWLSLVPYLEDRLLAVTLLNHFSTFSFSLRSVVHVLLICLVHILPPLLEYEVHKGRHICFSHCAPNAYTIVGK